MNIQALDLRPGMLVDHGGRMATVSWWNILRNDRRLFVQMKVKDLETGRVTEMKVSGDDKFEVLDKDEIELSYSYRDGPEEVFYKDNGEEVRCPIAAVEDALKWPADAYVGLVVAGKLVSVAPPRYSILQVTETTPPIKGAGTGMKEAILENGVKVKVNQLTDVGDRVRIEVETLEFKERITG
jgi:elongation factor P